MPALAGWEFHVDGLAGLSRDWKVARQGVKRPVPACVDEELRGVLEAEARKRKTASKGVSGVLGSCLQTPRPLSPRLTSRSSAGRSLAIVMVTVVAAKPGR